LHDGISCRGRSKCVAVKLNRLASQAFLDRGRRTAALDGFHRSTLKSEHGSAPAVPRIPPGKSIEMETEPMTSRTSSLRARIMLCATLGMVAVLAMSVPHMVDAQGLVKGVEKGAREGNKAAGPVGGVLGGAIGGVVGVVTGVTSALTGKGDQPAQPNDK